MGNSIRFELFAPYNQEAAVIGSFSDWEAIAMTKDDDGYFRTEVKLEDGEYKYKYRIRSKSWFFEPDEWVDVIDPYATDIDEYTQNGILRIKDGEKIVDTYVWQHDDKPLPSDRELVIYELHVGDFSGGEGNGQTNGKYQHVTEKLDYLLELGVNAIELMPVKENPGEYTWGYSPQHFFATESNYGSSYQLKRLIDECHGKGIRVIMDGIYNHANTDCPLTQIDHDYWFHHEPTDPDNSWGPEFNYEHYDENLDLKPAWKFMGDAVEYWIREYHLDGIRYDAARQIGNFDFMHWIVDKAHHTSGPKPFYNVAEHIPENPDITNVDGPMDGCWHYSFYYTLKEHLCGDKFELEELKDALDCKRQGYLGATNVVNYLSSHDHERLMVELGNRQILDDAAFKRVKLGYVLLMTAVGIPMLWMGEEFGATNPLSQESSKIDWKLLNGDRNKNLREYCRGLIHLRKENHALYTENIEFFHKNPEAKVFAYTRWNSEGSRVVVVVNFSDRFLAGYKVSNFPKNGTWHEWTGNYDIEAGENQIQIDLAEYEAKAFVW
ncbi:alpha-amylase family glycosyl hydrolase [Myxosarcina sp. GI1(2024)]